MKWFNKKPKSKCKPLIAPNHALTKKILDQVLPGKKVSYFSLHFEMDGVSFLRLRCFVECNFIPGVLSNLSISHRPLPVTGKFL